MKIVHLALNAISTFNVTSDRWLVVHDNTYPAAGANLLRMALGSIAMTTDSAANATTVANAINSGNFYSSGVKVVAAVVLDTVIVSAAFADNATVVGQRLTDSLGNDAYPPSNVAIPGPLDFVQAAVQTPSSRTTAFALGFAARALLA